MGDLVHTTEGPLGSWTAIEDIHVYFFGDEPLVSLPLDGNDSVEVTRWHQLCERGTSASIPASRVSSGLLLPAAPRLVFDLVTMGTLPIRCSQWTLASAPPDEDPQLDRYPCLPVSSIWETLRALWTPPPTDILLQKCQLYSGLLLAGVRGPGIISRVGALRMHSLAELIVLLFPDAYSRR